MVLPESVHIANKRAVTIRQFISTELFAHMAQDEVGP